ncbi:hypothetical protein B0H17DRAFT_1145973 [Mycena rosella]|uniref:Uncharacterized protein n=1 Tax=Mycena rosella TaxID=1033263 RepID=A0AAD7CPZ6_MYCRO|nr:hypothetical protein B0H17DRAFT_1145973 [Mycena rosella]
MQMGAPVHTASEDGSSHPYRKWGWERELPANIHLRVGAPSQYMGSVRELPAMWCGSTHAVVHGYIRGAMGPPTECQWKLPYKVYGSSRWCVKMSGGSIQGIGRELPQVGWELPQVGWELPQHIELFSEFKIQNVMAPPRVQQTVATGTQNHPKNSLQGRIKQANSAPQGAANGGYGGPNHSKNPLQGRIKQAESTGECPNKPLTMCAYRNPQGAANGAVGAQNREKNPPCGGQIGAPMPQKPMGAPRKPGQRKLPDSLGWKLPPVWEPHYSSDPLRVVISGGSNHPRTVMGLDEDEDGCREGDGCGYGQEFFGHFMGWISLDFATFSHSVKTRTYLPTTESHPVVDGPSDPGEIAHRSQKLNTSQSTTPTLPQTPPTAKPRP